MALNTVNMTGCLPRIDSLELETEANNTGIENIIKGDYTGAGDGISIAKTNSGIVISTDATVLTNELSGVPSGLATLGEDGKIPIGQIDTTKLPSADLTEVNTEIANIKKGDYLSSSLLAVRLTKTANMVTINTNIDISDVNGLENRFDGTTPIDDLSLMGQDYNLNDFMTIAQGTLSSVIYVRADGFNGTGERFTPFHTLPDAFSALTSTKNIIEVQDIGTFNLGAVNTSNLLKFYASDANIIGDITLSKNNCEYKVMNHTGNITVTGSNVTILISGTFNGTITVPVNQTTYIRANKFTTSMTHGNIESLKLYQGSVLGKYIFGMVAVGG